MSSPSKQEPTEVVRVFKILIFEMLSAFKNIYLHSYSSFVTNMKIILKPINSKIIDFLKVKCFFLLILWTKLKKVLCYKFALQLVSSVVYWLNIFLNCFQRLRRHSHWGKAIVNFLLILTQLGFCAIYFVFFAETVQSIMDDYDAHKHIDVHILITCFLLPVVLICLIRNLG